MGVVITREFWDNGYEEYDTPRLPKIRGRRDDVGYIVKADFNGWHITSIGKDELDAWQMTLDGMKCDVLEKPPNSI